MNGPIVAPKLYMLPKILERTACVDELSGIPFALAVLIISGIIGTKQNPPDKPVIGSTVYTNQILFAGRKLRNGLGPSKKKLTARPVNPNSNIQRKHFILSPLHPMIGADSAYVPE